MLAMIILGVGLAAAQTPDQLAAYTKGISDCTTETLTPLYSGPCATQLSTLSQAIAGAATPAAIDATCSSSCLPQFKTAYNSFGVCMTGQYDKLGLDPAVLAVLEKSDPSKIITNMLDFMCTKNDANGEYCVDDYLTFSTKIPTTASGRADAMCSAFGNMGCCLSSLIEAQGGSLTITDLCGGSLPPACLRSGETATVATGVISLANVLFSWYTGLSETGQFDFLNALRKDIAANAGVAIGEISTGNVAQNARRRLLTGMSVTVTIRGTDDTATNAAVALLSNFDGSNMINLAAVVPADGLVDSTAAVTASTPVVTSATAVGAGPAPSTSAAAATTVALPLAAVALLALLF